MLIIDDDQHALQLAHSVLEVHGHECLTASCAGEALALLDARPDIAILISDINMAEMDGAALMEQLASRNQAQPAPPVIFVAAHPRLDFAVAALRLGAVDFLVKPLRPQELLQALQNASQRAHRSQAATQPSDQSLSLAQQADAFAAALREWANHAQLDATITPSTAKPGANNARDFALLGMEQVRRLRRLFPPLDTLDDVAWDLLFELARAGQSLQRLSVSALCASIEHVSSTTSLRRIQELVKAGHIVRVPDPADARRDFVMLDPASRAVLDQYLERVAREFAAVVFANR